MGLAASQARLLSITRRISDNELRAQLINNEKMRLATESSKVSENYISALNSTNLMFTNYAANNAMQTIPLSYNALTSFNQYNNQYVLSDVAGAVFLREDEARLYAQSNHNLEDYLGLHGIEYTSTYWDVMADRIREENPNDADYATAIQEAAIVRAWYESIGIDALSSVSGVENLSTFSALYALTDRINATYAVYDSSLEERNAIISRAAGAIMESNDLASMFNTSSGSFWLNIQNSSGNPEYGQTGFSWFSDSWTDNGILNRFFTLPWPEYSNPTDLDSNAGKLWWGSNWQNDGYNTLGNGGFQDIYCALYCYGNNLPIPSAIDVSSFPSTYRALLEGYQPNESYTLAQFFSGCSNPPTSFGVGYSGAIQHDQYMFYSEFEVDEEYPAWGTDHYFIRWPDGNGNIQDIEFASSYSNQPLYLNNGFEWETIQGQQYLKYTVGQDNVYYIPYNPQGSNVAIHNRILHNTTDLSNNNNQDDATAYMKYAMKSYLKSILRVGERISEGTQWNNMRALGFSDREIEIINTPVDEVMGNELPDLIREYFNLFLGEGNGANNWLPGFGEDLYVYTNSSHIQNAINMVNYITQQLKNLHVNHIGSDAFGADPTVAENLFINGYAEGSPSAQDVLDQITLDMASVTYPFQAEADGLHYHFSNNIDIDPNTGAYIFTDAGVNDDYGLVQSNVYNEFAYAFAMDFFRQHGMPVYGYMKNGEDATAEAEWYTNLFNKLETSGFKTLEYGLASSTDWMRFALENGIGIIEQLNTDNHWNKIMYNSCSDITEETSSQRTTIAEAEYNKAMNQIQAKDQRLDMELKNIDTEHSSLQQEYESIKKAMTENIGRTFKLYT